VGIILQKGLSLGLGTLEELGREFFGGKVLNRFLGGLLSPKKNPLLFLALW